jgi:outer membrane protein
MLRSTRATLAVGLGIVGVAALVGRSTAQQADAKVRPAAGANTAAAATPAAPVATIGSIDMDKVLKDYDKFKVAQENLKAEAMARYQELMNVQSEAKKMGEMYAKYAPGSPDAKKAEEKMTQLKAQFEAGRENAEREFTQKEAETMATIYNEIAAMARGVAKQRNMTFVVKYSDQQPSGSEPNSVVAAMSRTILYADERVDITRDVTYWLNTRYKTSGGVAPKSTAPATAIPSAAPAGRQGTGTGGN